MAKSLQISYKFKKNYISGSEGGDDLILREVANLLKQAGSK